MRPEILNGHLLLLAVSAFLAWLFFVTKPSWWRRPSPTRLLLGSVAVLVAVLVTDFLVGWPLATGVARSWTVVSGYTRFWVALIGCFVGVVELVARYKDDPPRALRTVPAFIYVAVNMLAGIFVLHVLTITHPAWLTSISDAPTRELYTILAAGFGAVALFRSSIFKIKTADGELAVGPAIVLDTLLAASDRAVDRVVALPRGTAIAEIMKDISFEQAKVALPTYCFALMQNVSHQEQKEIGDQVNSLSTSGIADRIKSLNLGLALLNVVGRDVLDCAVKNLGKLIEGEGPIDQRDIAKVAALMKDVAFDKAAVALPTYCFNLVPTVSTELQATLAKQVDALAQSPLLPRVRSLVLGLGLANLVGYAVLKLAVEQLDGDIKR